MSLELRSLLPHPNSCLGTSPRQQGRVTKILSFCAIQDIVWADRLSGRRSVAPARWIGRQRPVRNSFEFGQRLLRLAQRQSASDHLLRHSPLQVKLSTHTGMNEGSARFDTDADLIVETVTKPVEGRCLSWASVIGC